MTKKTEAEMPESAKSRPRLQSAFFRKNPGILNDKDWLLAEIATIHYRERGIQAAHAIARQMN